jgi:hypothetical protein
MMLSRNKKQNMKKEHCKRLLFLQLFFLFLSCQILAQNKSKTENWVGTWATAQMLVEPNNMPPAPGLSENTLRQIIRVSIGGKRMRLRFSNIFSDQPTVLKSVSVANVFNAPIVDAKTQKELHFNGKPTLQSIRNRTFFQMHLILN